MLLVASSRDHALCRECCRTFVTSCLGDGPSSDPLRCHDCVAPTPTQLGWKADGAEMPVAEEDLAVYLRLRWDAKPRRWRDAID